MHYLVADVHGEFRPITYANLFSTWARGEMPDHHIDVIEVKITSGALKNSQRSVRVVVTRGWLQGDMKARKGQSHSENGGPRCKKDTLAGGGGGSNALLSGMCKDYRKSSVG